MQPSRGSPSDCETINTVIRAAALLLLMALTAPSIAVVVCEWSCAGEHAPVTTDAPGGCHEHGMPADVPSVSSGHSCHEFAGVPATVLTSVRSVDGPPAEMQSPESALASGNTPRALFDVASVSRPPGPVQLILPLRI
jgi:hypothetical protein